MATQLLPSIVSPQAAVASPQRSLKKVVTTLQKNNSHAMFSPNMRSSKVDQPGSQKQKPLSRAASIQKLAGISSTLADLTQSDLSMANTPTSQTKVKPSGKDFYIDKTRYVNKSRPVQVRPLPPCIDEDSKVTTCPAKPEEQEVPTPKAAARNQ